MKRRSLHRAVFSVAAVYNILWGLYAAVDPQWLFRFAELPLLNHPALFSCLGMVIGVYGIVYAEVARRPEHGFLLAAVGLWVPFTIYLYDAWPHYRATFAR